MAFYECIFIVRQDVPAADVHKLADKMVEVVSGHEGNLIKREHWGLRNLAYAIKKNRRGHYVMLGVSGSAEMVDEFRRTCKVNEDILKCLVIKVEKLDSSPSQMMQAPAEATLGGGNSDVAVPVA